MERSINTRNLLVRILSLLLVLNITVLGSNAYSEVSDESSIGNSSVQESTTVVFKETVEVSLDSFSSIGILIMIALSSLLGVFFIKDEFLEMLEEKF